MSSSDHQTEVQPSAPELIPTVHFLLLALGDQDYLQQLFNNPNHINHWPLGQLADQLQQEIENHQGDLWDWVTENNFEFDVSIYIGDHRGLIRCAEDPGLDQRRPQVIEISALAPIDLRTHFGTNDIPSALETISDDFSDQQVIDLCRRSGLFSACRVSQYQADSSHKALWRPLFHF